MNDFKDFDWSKIKVKYDHWFAPMIPFLMRNKNKLYGKVIGKTIYFSQPQEVVLRKLDSGEYRFKKLMRHEMQHVYQMHEQGTIWYLIQYGAKFFFNLFFNLKSWMNPYQAYLQISYEIDARHSEHQPLTKKELKVFTRK